MAGSSNPYRKLPGRGWRKSLFAVSTKRCRLWLAPDHLLAVEATVGSEEYRRFYFRDIEALIIRQTAGRQIWNWILLALVALVASPLLFITFEEDHVALLTTMFVLGALCLLFMLVNTLRGATCRTHIRTAVQTEHLPSLNRLPVARKVLHLLRPSLAEAQGTATPEEFHDAHWMDPADPSLPGANAFQTAPVRHERGIFHLLSAALLLGDGGLSIFAFLESNAAVTTVGMVLTMAGIIICLIALVQQRNSDVPLRLRIVTKASLGYYLLQFGTGLVFTVIYAVRHEGAPVVTGLEIMNEPGFEQVMLVSGVLSLVLGLLGGAWSVAHLRSGAARTA